MISDQPKVICSDVAGADEAVQELTEIKEVLEAPGRSRRSTRKCPKGHFPPSSKRPTRL